MKIIVSGMGIIGASLSASLRAAGHHVLGKNRSAEPLQYALKNGMIDGVATSYEGADVVFLALPPAVTLRALDDEYPEGIIVSDICGVKRALERAAFSKPRPYRYLGTHPMAGKETSGVRSASAALFSGANLVITVCEQTDKEALSVMRRLAGDMRFGHVIECSAEEHDRKIALTSQLAHLVSNAYIKSGEVEGCKRFTGGSFQDMTRVAGVDESLWAELFLADGDFLLAETDALIGRLTQYRDALAKGDEAKLRELLREGRIAKEAFSAED